MSKPAAFMLGVLAGFTALTLLYSQSFFRTCRNTAEKGFRCSNCESWTDYEPKSRLNFCPICGAFVMERKEA